MRLIDANVLLKQNPFTKIGGSLSEYNEGFLDCAEEAREAVKNAPTINPDDLRPHGWWIRLDASGSMANFKCSVCDTPNYVPTCIGEPLDYYCPTCGAMMDGKECCK